MLLNLMLGPLRSPSRSPFHAKAPHPDDAKRHPRTLEFRAWYQSSGRTCAVDESADRSLTIIRAVVTHPPLIFPREQIRSNELVPPFPRPRVG